MLVNLIINNRAGGNAPMIAQLIVEKLTPKPPPKKESPTQPLIAARSPSAFEKPEEL